MALVLAEVGPQLVLCAVHALRPLLLAHQIWPGLSVAHLCVWYSAAHHPSQGLQSLDYVFLIQFSLL